MSSVESALIAIERACGTGSVIRDPSVLETYAHDESEAQPCMPEAVVRVTSTADVSAVMKAAYEHEVPVTPRGGGTGRVGGAVPVPGGIVLAFEKMNAIKDINRQELTTHVQPGVITGDLTRATEEEKLFYPPDPNSRDSCEIGGNLAANAGGPRAFKYGVTREYVLGMDVVLADGTVLKLGRETRKGVTGYDLTALMIGSEGTLGIVTRVVVKLYPLTSSRQTVLMAMNSFDAVARVLHSMRTDLAGTLSAYEVMWNNYYFELTAEGLHKPPLDRNYHYYVLAEAEGSDAQADAGRFETLLQAALECGDVVDAVVPKSESERDSLWAIREKFEAAQPAYLYDVSMPIRAMSTYVEKLDAGLREWRPDATCNVFGHIADGNLHIFVKPYDDGIHHDASDRIVYGCLEGLGGSVSAEHGIGLEKKHWLGQTRSEAEIGMMRSLKKMLDPKNLLNPGKVV